MDIGAAIANHYICLRSGGREGALANFAQKNLTGAYFGDVALQLANFSGANLSGANFKIANLGVTNLTGANLAGADLFGASLWQANMLGAYWDYDLTRTRDYRRIQFTNQRRGYAY